MSKSAYVASSISKNFNYYIVLSILYERLDRNKVHRLRTDTEIYISTGFAALGELTSAKDIIYI